jgi:hypothetical protein
VLRALHERVHGANADYAEVLTRELVLEVILRALAEPALRALAFEAGQTVRPRGAYLRGELLRKLKEHGWLEDYRDPIDLKPTLKLSRAGGPSANLCRPGRFARQDPPAQHAFGAQGAGGLSQWT